MRTIPHAGPDGLESPPLSTWEMDSWIIHGLVEAFLAGPWDADGLADRGGRILRRRYRWLRPLVGRIMAAFPAGSPRPRAARLAAFLRADERLNKAARKLKPALRLFDRL